MIVLIGADILPTKNNINLFSEGNIGALLDESLEKELKNADYIILNLEGPITDTDNRISKAGPCLKAEKNSIYGLKKINPFFYTLANNHIMDYGYNGLSDTLQILDENEIAYAGIGLDINTMNHSKIVEVKGIKIGIYCCAEHEFSIATVDRAGANPFSELNSFRHVAELNRKCDYVIVLYHGGKEYYRYPAPHMRNVFHTFAEHGADIVIAQHTHCLGCKEEYKGSSLIYGQGNFLFDLKDEELTNHSMLIKLSLSPDGDRNIEFLPIERSGSRHYLSGNKEILEGFLSRSEAIKSDSFIKEKYSEYSKKCLDNYLELFMGRKSFFLRAANKLLNYKLFPYLIRKKYSERQLIQLQNYIECEAHRELLLEGIKLRIEEINAE